jgi:ketosteroid isomerase-like protein
MTSSIERTREVAQRYVDLFNTDVRRFVTECYAPDFQVLPVNITGHRIIRGYEEYIASENAILARQPKRRIRLDKMHVSEEMAFVEATLEDGDRPGFAFPFRAALRVRDGRIVEDWTFQRSLADAVFQYNHKW